MKTAYLYMSKSILHCWNFVKRVPPVVVRSRIGPSTSASSGLAQTLSMLGLQSAIFDSHSPAQVIRFVLFLARGLRRFLSRDNCWNYNIPKKVSSAYCLLVGWSVSFRLGSTSMLQLEHLITCCLCGFFFGRFSLHGRRLAYNCTVVVAIVVCMLVKILVRLQFSLDLSQKVLRMKINKGIYVYGVPTFSLELYTGF